MAIHTTSKTIARLLPLADLSGLATINPGGGRMWNNSGFLSIGAASAPAVDSAVVHKAGLETIDGLKTLTGGLNFGGSSYAMTLATPANGDHLQFGRSDTGYKMAYCPGAGTLLLGKDTALGFTSTSQATQYLQDVAISRYATGPALQVNAAGGLRVQNLAGTADAPITASNVAASGSLTLGGVAGNRWSSVSAGTSKWETDYAGVYTFSQLQSGQYMRLTLATAEGKEARLTHYDVNNVTYGRLFNIETQPGVPIRISPAGTQAVQFGTDGIATFSGTHISVGSTGWQLLDLGTNASCIANSGGTPIATFAGAGNTSHLSGAALSMGGSTAYFPNCIINLQTAGTFKFRKADGTTDADITAKSAALSGPVYVKAVGDGGTGADFYVAGNSWLAGNLTVAGTSKISHASDPTLQFIATGYPTSNWRVKQSQSDLYLQYDTASTFATAVNRLQLTGGASGWAIFNGPARFTDGQVYTSGNSINGEYNTNANGILYLNFYGYNSGATQSRDTIICDGKNAAVATFTGSTKAAKFGGSVGINTSPSNATGMTGGYVLHIAATNNPHLRLQNTTSGNEFVAYCGTGAAVLGTNTSNLLYLQTNNTFRWAVDASAGHFLAATDNTYDIGASGANRPRNVYLAGSLSLPTATFHTTGDGKNRFYFDGSGASYWYSGNGGTTASAHIWRQTSGATLMTLDGLGSISISGAMATIAGDTRFNRSAAQQLKREAYDATLAAWQEIDRAEASPSGAVWGVFGKGALQQAGGLMTAGAAYTANEQTMLQTLWNMARTFGFLD